MRALTPSCIASHRNLSRHVSDPVSIVRCKTGVCDKQLRRRRTLGQVGFKNTKSVAGEQLLLKDCKAKVRIKGLLVPYYTHRHTGINHIIRTTFKGACSISALRLAIRFGLIVKRQQTI